MPGPKRKSKHRSKTDGTYRKDRDKDDIADALVLAEKDKSQKLDPDIPKTPAILGKIGKAEWIRIFKIVHKVSGYILPTDHVLLEQYCLNYQFMIDAAEHIQKEGLVLEKGGMNPYFRVYNKCMIQHVKLSAQLAFSPADRTKVNLQLHISNKINKGFKPIPSGRPDKKTIKIQ